MKLEFTTHDGESFPYRAWNADGDPHTIIIAIHGISGAAQDFTGLANHLAAHAPRTALYCQETRGQGLDPIPQRRGDIHHPAEWYQDFYAFTRLVKSRHPHAHLIACGESMGSLIITHALVAANTATQFSGLILLSPVVNIGNQIPNWKLRLGKLIAAILPKWRIRLDALSGTPDVKVTQGETSHNDQSATNPWHIQNYTLRLLATLGHHIENMPSVASQLHLPTLLLSGGNDYFTPPDFIHAYATAFPKTTQVRHAHFPAAYHLLMYDDERERIFDAIVDWLRDLRNIKNN